MVLSRLTFMRLSKLKSLARLKFVLEKCPNLQFRGLMTIGALAHSVAKDAEGPNPDFLTLIDCRKYVCQLFVYKIDLT